MRSLADDRGAVRVVTLGRILVILAILGVIGYDSFSVMSTRVSTENDAQNAAYAASQAWHDSHGDINTAYQAAVTELATNPAEKVLTTGFVVDPDGTVHLTVTRTAHTVLYSHIGALKSWVHVAESGDANSVN